jgi:hypothetical protein
MEWEVVILQPILLWIVNILILRWIQEAEECHTEVEAVTSRDVVDMGLLQTEEAAFGEDMETLMAAGVMDRLGLIEAPKWDPH